MRVLVQTARKKRLLRELPAVVGRAVDPMRSAAQNEFALRGRQEDVLTEQAADRRLGAEEAPQIQSRCDGVELGIGDRTEPL